MARQLRKAPRRPVIDGIRKPLAEGDPEKWWEEEAARRGMTARDLHEEIRRADEFIESSLQADHASPSHNDGVESNIPAQLKRW